MPESIEKLTPLDEFRLEIAELKKEEEKKGKEAHFKLVSPENLTEQDMELYTKFKNETLEVGELKGYRNEICDGNHEDSCEFAAFLANQTDYWMKKWGM